MFTGIITDIGTVKEIESLDKGKRFNIVTSYDTNGIDLGASIAHSGVCLTVVERGEDWFAVEAWEEALRLTTLDAWVVGQKINLERSLKVGDELGGHIVSGHVDGVAKVIDVIAEGDATRFVLDAPEPLAKYIAQKGSVALDGTSLTVNKVDGTKFDVLLIAHSQSVTTWGAVKKGDLINLEIDTMARYASRLMEFNA